MDYTVPAGSNIYWDFIIQKTQTNFRAHKGLGLLTDVSDIASTSLEPMLPAQFSLIDAKSSKILKYKFVTNNTSVALNTTKLW